MAMEQPQSVQIMLNREQISAFYAQIFTYIRYSPASEDGAAVSLLETLKEIGSRMLEIAIRGQHQTRLGLSVEDVQALKDIFCWLRPIYERDPASVRRTEVINDLIECSAILEKAVGGQQAC